MWFLRTILGCITSAPCCCTFRICQRHWVTRKILPRSGFWARTVRRTRLSIRTLKSSWTSTSSWSPIAPRAACLDTWPWRWCVRSSGRAERRSPLSSFQKDISTYIYMMYIEYVYIFRLSVWIYILLAPMNSHAKDSQEVPHGRREVGLQDERADECRPVRVRMVHAVNTMKTPWKHHVNYHWIECLFLLGGKQLHGWHLGAFLRGWLLEALALAQGSVPQGTWSASQAHGEGLKEIIEEKSRIKKGFWRVLACSSIFKGLRIVKIWKGIKSEVIVDTSKVGCPHRSTQPLCRA